MIAAASSPLPPPEEALFADVKGRHPAARLQRRLLMSTSRRALYSVHLSHPSGHHYEHVEAASKTAAVATALANVTRASPWTADGQLVCNRVRRLRLRTRCGAWRTFERRFEPIARDDEAIWWEAWHLPKGIDPHLVWTITDEDGRLYANPGYRFVNRLMYLVCAKPWTEDDARQPPYRYD